MNKITRTAIRTSLMILLMATYLTCSVTKESNEPNNSAKTGAVLDMIKAKKYVFIAESVRPTGAGTKHLTTDYSLTVTPDTVTAYLPYFGKAYNPTFNQSNGGINFTSTNFEYSTSDRPKGGWDIVIDPKDQMDVQHMMLTVFENGTASLQVSSNTRQAISYDGYVK